MTIVRRTLAALAAPALALGIVACGGEEEPVKTTPAQEEEPAQDEPLEEDKDEDSEEENEDASQEDGSGEGPGGEDSGEEGSDAAQGEPTVIGSEWIEDDWELTEVDQDLCDFSIADSPFSDNPDVFSCGATADSAVACVLDVDQMVQCVESADSKKAIFFESSAVAGGAKPEDEAEPTPIRLELTDGTSCSPAAHAGMETHDGKAAWYGCEDGSELLADIEEGISSTVNTSSDVWTVERIVDGGDPETTAVRSAFFAEPPAD
ncbi:hypothetical protein [Brachybacterium sp. UMB0905]|uniref:hypothetical protein n=1 Tax=Brachybacterium sp. UMB0905 TaxID=2069310 RepID=UPI000C80AFFD|nr:hypothetical protein [Brachybacterium sp. UMB0905]PMC75443.1 hypothetical protein CJ197_08945 [Brachybacterium sp. UMB0905]